MDEDSEVISIYYGEDISEAEAREAAAAIELEALYPDC